MTLPIDIPARARTVSSAKATQPVTIARSPMPAMMNAQLSARVEKRPSLLSTGTAMMPQIANTRPGRAVSRPVCHSSRENPAVTSDSTGPSEEAAGRSEAAMRTRLARANASRPRERRNPSSGEVVMGTSFQTAVVSRCPVRADCALAWDGDRRTQPPMVYR